MIEEAVCVDDLLLVPQFSDIASRKECGVGTQLGQLNLAVPIISSPMDTVTMADMAAKLGDLGGLGIIHRYLTIENQAAEVKKVISKMSAPGLIGAAVGSNGDFLERAQELVKAGVQVICVDVAHGYHELVKNAIQALKTLDVHVMAGNVATAEGYCALANWGASSVRCGIGSGSACTTRGQTGHGVPNFHVLQQIAQHRQSHQAAVIIDGGITNAGQMVKYFAIGADAVMLGSFLAGTDESPGKQILDLAGNTRKEYSGMSSKQAQMRWRGWANSAEGVSASVPTKGPVAELIQETVGHLRSGLSYSGARSLAELRDKAVWVRQTGSGQLESSPHILRQ